MTSEYTQSFKENAEIYRSFNNIVRHSENFYEQLETNRFLKEVSSLYSIGAGEGELEAKLAKKLGLRIGYNEPAPDFQKAFLKKIAELGIEKQILEKHFSEFQKAIPNYKYDAAIAIHSWYAFGKDKTVLEKALNLTKTGKLFITLVSRESITYELGNLTKDFAGTSLTSEDLSAFYDKVGFGHSNVMNHKLIPLETFFTVDHLTKKGQDFVSFLCGKPWNDLSEKLKEKAGDLFAQHSSSSKIDLKCGCLIFGS